MVTLLIVWGRSVRRDHALRRARAGAARARRGRLDRRREPLAGVPDVTIPTLKPILLILTSLSIIWDFAVFTQPYLLIGASKMNESNYLMGVYVYIEGYAHPTSAAAPRSRSCALIVAALSVVYVRKMVRMEETA